jgi:hypothetical protein
VSAIGLLLVGFGILTAWAALQRTNVFDVLRSILGAKPVERDEYGKPKDPSVTA